MKKDINVYYDTYGFEGERDYAVDGNGEYQPSDYDKMCDTNDHISIKHHSESEEKTLFQLKK